MRNFFFILMTALILLFGPVSSVSAAVTYQYNLIAESGRDFLELGPLSINNKGVISFQATTPSGRTGVFAGKERNQITTIMADTGLSLGSAVNSINDLGEVAFMAGQPRTIFVGSGGPITPIFAGNDVDTPIQTLVLNNNGSVLFELSHPTSNRRSLAYASRGTVTLIPNSDHHGYSNASYFLNNKDVAVFSIPTESSMLHDLMKVSRAGAPATILMDAQHSIFQNMMNVSINDRGTIAFSGHSINNPEIDGIYKLAHGKLTRFSQGGGPTSINNHGAIAFHTGTDRGIGIFTGPDMVADKVIHTGDSLFGSTVVAVGFGPEGLNDLGEVAFWARLEDGRHVIVRACPVSR